MLMFLFCLGLSWTLTGSTYQVRVDVYISLNGGGTFKECSPKVCSFGMFPGGSSEWPFMQRVSLRSCPSVWEKCIYLERKSFREINSYSAS